MTEALTSLRSGHFFDAHEQLEDLFRGAEGDRRTLLQALAQLAAAHHQLSLGRARAAVRTWHKARTKLARIGCLPPGFAAEMAAFHERLGITEEGPRFIPLEQLGPLQSFPAPADDLLQTPSA